MQIEELRIRNFRALRDVHIRNIPRMAIFIGANGAGKSTLLSVFGFLRDAMNTDVKAALYEFGGSRGIDEVRTRNANGPISIEVKYRVDSGKPLVTYLLEIDKKDSQPVVSREILSYRRFRRGKPWHFLDFREGRGSAATGEADTVYDERELRRDFQTLRSPDLLAIKGLSQFKRFPAIAALGKLLERWHVSKFHINQVRRDTKLGYAEHLSQEGDNLPLVIEYLHNEHNRIFRTILERLQRRVPGISKVEARRTEEGRILLRFQDSVFEDPFHARHVSDGTIKMLAYLTLLYDPDPYPLLCVEEPENQLYPMLLEELAEEFQFYANEGRQVFISTHSPDFLNAASVEDVFWLRKENGHTKIERARDNDQVADYMRNGDKMGYLWKQGLFEGLDPY